MLPTARFVLPDTSNLQQLADDELLLRQAAFAALRRRVEAGEALVAAEIARRSSVELGHSGLAQREGARSAERLLERLAGVTPAAARAMVRVGRAPDPLVAAAVGSGEVSVVAADAILSGLGEPSDTIPPAALHEATALLLSVAPEVSPRRLAAEARAVRDRLDAEGTGDREQLLRDRRFLRLAPQPDGMTRVHGLLDPESAALVTSAFDAVTAPRRGGPRFAEASASDAPIDDQRTIEQVMADALVEMVRIAGAADRGRLFRQHRPAVTVHVTQADLVSGAGAAHLEGQTAAVSVATARRLACAEGTAQVLFAGDRPIALGRTQRLFTEAQRLALAARDGGCLWGDCDRPPSWCEAHHITEWSRGGSTDVDAGVLLCRFHHLMVHNQGWSIRRGSSGFEAMPPPGSGRHPAELRSKHPLHRHVALAG
ncbi:MAG TPA: DUF222 domain-containing protein [Microbacterium sp.]|nr:DUF222 domain-containing protein [Microbacterium sp.]